MQNRPNDEQRSKEDRFTQWWIEGVIGLPIGLPPAKPHDKEYMKGWNVAEALEFETKLLKMKL